MSRPYDKPIIIQKLNELTETWENVFEKPIHARINKAKSDSEYLNAGAIQGKKTRVFEVRYFAELEDIDENKQLYRIVYRDIPYDIKDYDDYMEQHKTIKLLGESY